MLSFLLIRDVLNDADDFFGRAAFAANHLGFSVEDNHLPVCMTVDRQFSVILLVVPHAFFELSPEDVEFRNDPLHSG